MNIKAYYHLYIPDDLRASMWHWWVDEYMAEMRASGLLNIADLSIHVTMPQYWSHVNGIQISSATGRPMLFGEKVVEYFEQRWGVTPRSIRDTGLPNIYEGQTLFELYHDAVKCDQDTYILYTHSKGVVSASPTVGGWRQMLHHFMIREWTKAIPLLDTYDVVGVKDAKSRDMVTSGNFWWSNSWHIKTLQNPTKTNLYAHDPTMFPGQPAYRYGFELWVMQHADVQYVFDSNKDHFVEYILPQEYKKPH